MTIGRTTARAKGSRPRSSQREPEPLAALQDGGAFETLKNSGGEAPTASVADAADSYVRRAYDELKAAAIDFRLKPGTRLNEIELAQGLGISRTPLREALQRLHIEGFLKLTPGKGFFCRDLDPREIFDLYELRKTIEVGAIQIAATRAQSNDIDTIEAIQEAMNAAAAAASAAKLLAYDEMFHERMAALTGNSEMVRVLQNINARIRFVRVVASDWSKHGRMNREHRLILKLLRQQDPAGCAKALGEHIDVRLDQVMTAVKDALARIYLPTTLDSVLLFKK